MAATSYYTKTGEDATSVSYVYGDTPETMNWVLIIDKATLMPVSGSETSVGLLGRLALSQITKKHRDRDAWPERGARFV